MHLSPRILMLSLFVALARAAKFPVFHPKAKLKDITMMLTAMSGGVTSNQASAYSSFYNTKFSGYYDDVNKTNLVGFRVVFAPFPTINSTGWADSELTFGEES